MKKFLVLVVSVVTLVVMTVSPIAFAANSNGGHDPQQAAENLYSMGLFKGVGLKADKTPDFALDKEPTRQESVVMLIRLLGKEDKALEENNVAPFDDVQKWAMPYVGYAYKHGLAKGIDDRTFGAQNPTAAYMYLTFVLRALGYEDGKDFSWLAPWELSDRIGLVEGEYSYVTDKFTRGDAAIISNEALEMTINGTDPAKKLFDFLSESGAIHEVDIDDQSENLVQSIIAENAVTVKKPTNEDPNKNNWEYLGEYKLSFYCACAKCCGKTDGITASGAIAKEGTTIAVDPRKIPLGSKVYIEGWGTYIAQDTGGAIKQNRIDVFMSSHQRALNAGIAHAKVWIVERPKK